MDGAGALAERASVAVDEDGLHLGQDGEGDLFGRVGPEVEADGRMKAGAHFSRDRQAIAREIGEDALGAFFGPRRPRYANGRGSRARSSGTSCT